VNSAAHATPGGEHFWDGAAVGYGAGSSFFADAGEALVATAGLTGGESVADIACGTGASLLPAARLLAGGGFVIGVDRSVAMAALARRAVTAASADLASVRVAAGDVLALPLRDAAFDVVLCGLGVGFFTDLVGALAEVARVLRPGGRFSWSVAAGGGPGWGFLGRAYARFGLLRMLTAERAGNSRYSMPAALDSAGLEPQARTEHVIQTRFASADAWWEWLLATGMGELIARLDPGARAAFRDSVIGSVSLLADGHGIQLSQRLIVSSATRRGGERSRPWSGARAPGLSARSPR
jgi:SAM-dependent methyltransferase